jgi:hypothetical protein
MAAGAGDGRDQIGRSQAVKHRAGAIWRSGLGADRAGGETVPRGRTPGQNATRLYGLPTRRGGLPSFDSNPREAEGQRRQFLTLPHSYDLFDRRAERVMGLVVTRERCGFSGAEVLWIWYAGGHHLQLLCASG